MDEFAAYEEKGKMIMSRFGFLPNSVTTVQVINYIFVRCRQVKNEGPYFWSVSEELCEKLNIPRYNLMWINKVLNTHQN